ncbi:hypothetical protein HF685_14035 [Parasphingorhabdus halotolerans]|uniref:MarR family transcriptional regulator n=1 Tax=Parasphingorhabdus halotolerans TaxID=2725558 RepID=A0A6H2DPI9_9SPHN|nr:hypothetical protein HF685_14035 [Parasphingorhabdus halotolerans]
MTGLDVARGVYNSRQTRDRLLKSELPGLEEPIWDIVIFLYIAQCENRTIYVSDIVTDADIPPTTRLGCIDSLTSAGWIDRGKCAEDKRRVCVKLKSSATEKIAMLMQDNRSGPIALVMPLG